ncbi:MAG: hypothetical protein ACI8RD_011379 [Bacillariaceae sp.]|jgi:hypothetical protein
MQNAHKNLNLYKYDNGNKTVFPAANNLLKRKLRTAKLWD